MELPCRRRGAMGGFSARRDRRLSPTPESVVARARYRSSGRPSPDGLGQRPACGRRGRRSGRVLRAGRRTLGGQHLLPIVHRKLGLSATHRASYLASYGPDVHEMWRRFSAIVDARCATPEAREHASDRRARPSSPSKPGFVKMGRPSKHSSPDLNQGRHCERNEAIHPGHNPSHGLLRFARNDGSGRYRRES